MKIYDIVFLLFCFVNKLKNKIYNYTIIIENTIYIRGIKQCENLEYGLLIVLVCKLIEK